MSKIHLKNVRLSFPSLFKKATFEGVETKYEATFLISKEDVKTKKILDNEIQKMIKESKIKFLEDNICLRDGNKKMTKEGEPYDGYPGHWSLKASNEKRPTIINRDKTPLTEEDEALYAGCYVNVIVDFWIQTKRANRVNANLHGVQFFKDGEPFGSGAIDVVNEFDDLKDDLEDDDF